MQRVTVEEKVKITDKIYEIKQRTYLIPQRVMHEGVVLEYDSDYNSYISISHGLRIPVYDYIEMMKGKELNKESNTDTQKAEDSEEIGLIRKMIISLDKMFPGMNAESKNAMLKEYCDFDLEAMKQKYGVTSDNDN